MEKTIIRWMNRDIGINHHSFSIYPNPAKSFINVRTNGSTGYSLLVVTNMAGHTVLTHKMQGILLEQIALGTLAKGTYTVSVFTLTGKQSQQIVIISWLIVDSKKS